MGNKMSIYVSPGFNKDGANKSQRVEFINVFSSYNVANEAPTEISYEEAIKREDSLAIINYKEYLDKLFKISEKQGYSKIYGSDQLTTDIFKREVEIVDGEVVPLTSLKLVCENLEQYSFKDYNISNDRMYQYVIYPSQETEGVIAKVTSKPIKTNWQGWSITELHPTDTSGKRFKASIQDVWLFNLNVETGEQTQNFSRQEQQTLGQFNRYSSGRMNYISGSVSCLFGSDVIPAFMLDAKHGYGYQEIRKYATNYTSNQRIDMLKAWRNLVYSSNPKLLKDRAGQSFLITINSSANKPMDNVRKQPNTISFNWAQIGTLDDVTIIG